jgi:hypothetical protein
MRRVALRIEAGGSCPVQAASAFGCTASPIAAIAACIAAARASAP